MLVSMKSDACIKADPIAWCQQQKRQASEAWVVASQSAVDSMCSGDVLGDHLRRDTRGEDVHFSRASHTTLHQRRSVAHAQGCRVINRRNLSPQRSHKLVPAGAMAHGAAAGVAQCAL